jgi:hypothetical protein
VTTIKPHLAGIECPDVLRALPGWVIWRYETHDGEDKPRKVPFYVSGARRHGVQGRPEDRQQLVTFDAARTAAIRRGFDGVGFCPMPEWGIVALDFDGAIIDGGLHPEVERLVAGTYAEWSPSGQGVRAFMRGDLGNRKDHQRIPFGFETFSSKGFVTLTGNVLPITELTDSANTVADVSEPVRLLCMQRFGRSEGSAEPATPSSVQPLGLTPDQLQDALDVLDPSMGHDPWLRVGMALHHETAGEGFELWDTWSSHGVQYPGREIAAIALGKLRPRRPASHHRARARAHGQRPGRAHRDRAAGGRRLRRRGRTGRRTEAFALPAGAGRLVRLGQAHGLDHQGRAAARRGGDGLRRVRQRQVLRGAGPGRRGRARHRVARQAHEEGPVVYVVAEGAAGFRNRLKAYAAKHGIDLTDLDVWVIHAAPNMLLKEDALDVCKSILASGGADLVIVDTFAQVTPGANENAAEDMGKALAHCRGIHVATGAVVLLVHHSGKDQSRGARGWSGLKGAMDTQIEVLKLATGRMLRVSKQKDGEDGLAWGFELDQVPVGQDEDGDLITSCVVRETDAPAIQQVLEARRGLGKLQRAVLAVVDEMAQAQTDGIEVDAVLTEVVRRTGREGTRNAKSHAMRALNEICERDDVAYEIHDGVVRVV